MRNIAIGSSNRSAAVAAVFSVLSLLPIVPHVVEDVEAGFFSDLGVDPQVGAWTIGGVLAMQMVFALASFRERRWGFGGVFVLAAIWVAAAFVDHSAAFLPGDFRAGLWSRMAVWGIVVFQGIAALGGLAAFRGSRKTSFSGTGNFSV